MTDLHRALRDRARFRRQIERLFDRVPPAAKAWILREEGVPLDALFDRRRRLARLISRTIKQNAYEFRPGRIREIRVQGKRRDVFLSGSSIS